MKTAIEEYIAILHGIIKLVWIYGSKKMCVVLRVFKDKCVVLNCVLPTVVTACVTIMGLLSPRI